MFFDQKVFNEKYLPEALPLYDLRKAEISLGQLLSMAAGLHGEGANPGFVDCEPHKVDPLPRPDMSLGQDLIALRIREIAAEHDIAIVENPPLARAIYKQVEVDQEIPAEFFSAVAEVLAYVYRTSRRKLSWA